MNPSFQRPVVWVPAHLPSAYLTGVFAGISRYRNQYLDWSLEYPPMPYPKDPPPQVIGAFLWEPGSDALRHLAEKIPCVQLSNRAPMPEVPLVTSDDVRVGELAAEHFLKRHFRRFAFIGPPKDRYSLQRLEGFSRSLRHWNSSFPLHCFRLVDHRQMTMEGELPKLLRLVQSESLPLALFCANDWWANFVLEQLRARQIMVPGEVAVLGVDNEVHVCEMSYPPLSSVELPGEEIGFEAAKVMDLLIQGEEVPDVLRIPVNRVMVRKSSEVTAVADPVVSGALSILQQEFRKEVDIADLARRCGVSRRVLERRFKKEVQRSPYQCLLRFRVEEAKSLLRSTNWSIQKISQDCGFPEQRYLSVHFKALEGITPRQWRRASRSGGEG